MRTTLSLRARALPGDARLCCAGAGADARTADIRSDIYSIGCVLYHLLAGQTVFPDTNIINQLVRHASEPPRLLRGLNADVPEELQQIASAMLAKEPSARYQTPERAARALQAFLDAVGAAPKETEDSEVLESFLSWIEDSGKQAIPLSQQPVPTAPAEAKPPPAAAETAPAPRKQKGHAKGDRAAERGAARGNTVPGRRPGATRPSRKDPRESGRKKDSRRRMRGSMSS